MIYLVTGRPGAGKTSNILAMLIRESSVKTSLFGLRRVPGLFTNRQVLINHVDGLDFPSFGKISDADIIACNVPQGAVILIDEGHRLFPKRPSAAQVPDHVSWWAEHRHAGVDLYLVTQNPADVDFAIRTRVESHTHYVKAFGLNTMSYTWPGVCDKPDNRYERNEAIKKSVSVDKSVFARYTSTTQDTTQRRVPALFYWLPLLFLAVVISGWYGISSVMGNHKTKTMASAAPDNHAVAASTKSAIVTVAKSVPVIDYSKLTYSGIMTIDGRVKRYYSLQSDNGSSMPLEDVDLLAMGLTVTIISGHPAVLLPDGTLHLIPWPSPDSSSYSDEASVPAGDSLGPATAKIVSNDIK
jgi:zona occludens toxin (predicted ATPase)